jgi:hypothetical protein
MSSKANKISKELVKAKHLELYTTLPGSIVSSIAMLSGVSTEDQLKYFEVLKKWVEKQAKENETVTVIDIFNHVANEIGKLQKEWRSKYILIFDKNNVLTPLVTIVDDEGNPLPLTPEGFYYGVMQYAIEGRDNIDYEFLFDENGDEIVD